MLLNEINHNSLLTFPLFSIFRLTDVEETWNLLAKLMSQHGIAIGHVHAGILGNYSEESKCDDKPPLHFLPSSDRKSQQLLHEVIGRAYPNLAWTHESFKHLQVLTLFSCRRETACVPENGWWSSTQQHPWINSSRTSTFRLTANF